MEVYVYNADLKLVGIVDAYKSLIWAKRYREIGDCELYVPATPEHLDMIRRGYFVRCSDDDMICQIKKLELDTDAENGNYIIASGFDAKRLLDQRIVWTTTTAYGGRAETFARKIVDAALGENASEERQLLDSDGNLIFGLGDLAGLEDRLSEQVSYKNVGEKIREYCLKFGWGYRVRLDDDGVLRFEVYKGADRSDSVIFSDDYENLSTTEYVEDETNMGNVVMIAGEGEGSARMRTVSGNAEGAERYELYDDARDLSKTITYEELTDTYPLVADGGTGVIVNTGSAFVYELTTADIMIYGDAHLAWLTENYPDGTVVTVDGVDYYRLEDLVIADLPSSAPADTDNVTLYDVVYMTYLYERGFEDLSEFGFVTSFSGTIEPNTTFRYKIDYDIGDVVTVKNELGISAAVRIVEVVECWDDSGYNVEPKFENITEEG